MKQSKKNQVLWITQTALFIALLIVAQFITKSATQLVTGSVVNFLLVASTLTAGLYSGLTVAIVSPIFATLLGISGFWLLVPAIAVGNAVIVLVFSLFVGRAERLGGTKKYFLWLAAIALGAAAKFFALYLGVVKIIIPIISDTLNEKQIANISAMFSLPQLFTALIGGAIAMVVVPSIKAALKKSKVS